MKCDFCDAPATVFFTQAVGGGMVKKNFCDACAADHGLTDGDAYPMLEKIMDEIPKEVEMLLEGDAGQCEHCGFTMEDYRKVGRLGCSHCYDAFADEISRGLEKMHTGVVHEGKVPEGIVQDIEREQELESLKSKLAIAIDAEDFEKAAELRDAIKAKEA